jgi:2'-5' RNA ligase
LSAENLKQGYQRYFIAIIPPSPIFDEALVFKNYFKEKYSSRASLNSPPHITLRAPFAWKEDDESQLMDSLKAFASGEQQFTIELNGFDTFPQHVIFIAVKGNALLDQFQNQLEAFCETKLNLSNTYKDQSFHPHLTLAFRDLRKEKFVEAWGEFKEKPFSAAFTVKQFTLLKHNGKLWQPLHSFRF